MSRRILPVAQSFGHVLTILTDGEFHVDLYTLPDPLIKMLWDFAEKRVDMSVLA